MECEPPHSFHLWRLSSGSTVHRAVFVGFILRASLRNRNGIVTIQFIPSYRPQ